MSAILCHSCAYLFEKAQIKPSKDLRWPRCKCLSSFKGTKTEEESHSKAQFDFLQSPLCAANRLQHVRSSGPGAIVCKPGAAHRPLITRNMVRRDSSAIKFDRVEIAFILALFCWLNRLPMKEGRKPEYPEKTPGDELQKMPHTKARRLSPARLEPRTTAVEAD